MGEIISFKTGEVVRRANHPSPEEVRAFIEDPWKEAVEDYRNDLLDLHATHNDLVNDLNAIRRRRESGEAYDSDDADHEILHDALRHIQAATVDLAEALEETYEEAYGIKCPGSILSPLRIAEDSA